LALLNEEPGSEVVEKAIPGAAISAVNLSEVVAKLVENDMPEEIVRLALGGVQLDVYPFEAESAYQAGILRAATKKAGLSLGDRACIALGKQLSLPVWTTDRNWKAVDAGVEVRVIR
jgi:PIN domain nuclease of toxin-antitoxin system